MKEILYKAKRADGKGWVEGLPGYWNWKNYPDCSVRGIEFEPGSMEEIIPETLCQFIGLTDKNGTKIFEGDECKGNFNTSKKIGFIIYSKKLASFRICGHGWSDAVTAFNKLEVIGNIHDKTK